MHINTKIDYRSIILKYVLAIIRYTTIIIFITVILFNANAQPLSGKIPSVSSTHVVPDTVDQIINHIDSLEEMDDYMHKIVFGLDYMNKVVYWGRDFGINQFGIMSTLMYVNPKGFYVFYTGYYWSGEVNKYGKTDLGIGYEHFLTNRWYVLAEYNRWIFNNGDKAARNSITDFFSLESSYDLDLFTIGSSFYFMTGTEQDYIFNMNIMKQLTYYKLLGADKIFISPTFYITTASRSSHLPINQNQFTIGNYENKPFGIINYEFILPVTYKIIGITEITLAYHYAYPTNQNPKLAIKPINYFTVESSWTLKRWKSKKKD